jgi:hypothetical protein
MKSDGPPPWTNKAEVFQFVMFELDDNKFLKENYRLVSVRDARSPLDRLMFGVATYEDQLWAVAQIVPSQEPKKLGRRPKPKTERQAANPTHQAARDMKLIEHILWTYYPERRNKRSAEGIKHRAIEIATRLHGIQPGTLMSLLKRGPRDQH